MKQRKVKLIPALNPLLPPRSHIQHPTLPSKSAQERVQRSPLPPPTPSFFLRSPLRKHHEVKKPSWAKPHVPRRGSSDGP